VNVIIFYIVLLSVHCFESPLAYTQHAIATSWFRLCVCLSHR